MINNHMKKFKYILLSLMILSVVAVSIPSSATTPIINMTEKLTLTFDDCVDRALNTDETKYQYTNNTLLKIDLDLKAARRGYDQAVVMQGLGQSLYVDLTDYQSLATAETALKTEKDTLTAITTPTAAEISRLDTVTSTLARLDGYNTKYSVLLNGTSPTTIQLSNVFDQYIKPYSTGLSGIYDLESSISTLEFSKDVTKNSIAQGVRKLYDAYFSYSDALALQEKSYEAADKQYKLLLISYQNGQSPEIDKYKAEIDLEKLKINIGVTKRSIENYKLQIKKMIGVWPEQEIELKPYRTDDKVKEPLTYEQYINKAIDKRLEVISAMSDQAAKGNMFELTKKYFIDTSSLNYIEAQIAVNEKSAAVENAKNSITQDIKVAYNEVVEKRNNIEITKQKLVNIDIQYKHAQKQYEQGMLSQADLLRYAYEVRYLSAQMACRTALRDYDTALYKLEMASDFGPQYAAKGGTY